MKIQNAILTISLLFVRMNSFSQINMDDSTAQVITYWDKGEKQSYFVSLEKYKIKGTDTTSRELINYDVDITVLDSSAKSYTIEWVYKNMSSNNPDSVMQKIMNISKDMRVVFKIDETGSFLEVVNWKEVQNFIKEACKALSKEYESLPNMSKFISQIEATYSSKAAIESASIKDILQFHSFHGAKYRLGEELTGQLKVPNLFGSEPFDADITVSLDEINEEDNDIVIRSWQEINKEQFRSAAINYLKKMANSLEIKQPEQDFGKDLGNEIVTTSKIHGSGWVLFSIQTITISLDSVKNIEERIIELK